MSAPGCARCPRPVAPTADGWVCPAHGLVDPLSPAVEYAPHAVAALLSSTGVPAWVPWPLPKDWSVSGLRWTGDPERTTAIAVGCTGPGLWGGVVDLVIVAEEPGVGLGARFAGIDRSDPGPEIAKLPEDAKVVAAGHPTPVWSITDVSDRAAYVGEAAGRWLWLVVWPVGEWMVVHGDLTLIDLRDAGLAYEVPSSGLSGPLLT